MSPLNAEKYNVAWFKLAEFVRRGEKERALGMYRLLAHSLTDNALSYQLEGDLLLSFHDHKAIEAYTRAAAIYEQQNKLNQSIGIFEHLVLLVPDNPRYYGKLIELYSQIDHIENLIKKIKGFVDLSVSQNQYEQLYQFCDTAHLPRKHRCLLYQQLILQLVQFEERLEAAYSYIQKISQLSSEHEFIDFISRLREINEDVYLYACQFKVTAQ